MMINGVRVITTPRRNLVNATTMGMIVWGTLFFCEVNLNGLGL